MAQELIENRIDRQYRRPAGYLGRVIGRRMARDHQTENLWTVARLDVQPTDHILEVGFGPGVAIQALTKIVTRGRVAGLDYSKTMVAAAQKRNAAAIRRGLVDLHYGDVADLPFTDNTFETVFGIHTIYFWRDPLRALREAQRVLKQGGQVALTILPKEKWNRHNPTAAVGTPFCIAYSADEIVQMLTVAGFSSPRIEVDHDPDRPSNCCVIGVKPQQPPAHAAQK